MEDTSSPHDSTSGRTPDVGTRREQRDRLLGLIYQLDVRECDAETVLMEQGDEVEAFVAERLIGVEQHQLEIDALLDSYAEQWTVSRMPALDRAALRLATYELLYCTDLPVAVVVAEAVELVRKYSTAESQRFVNGLLARIASVARPVAVP